MIVRKLSLLLESRLLEKTLHEGLLQEGLLFGYLLPDGFLQEKTLQEITVIFDQKMGPDFFARTWVFVRTKNRGSNFTV